MNDEDEADDDIVGLAEINDTLGEMELQYTTITNNTLNEVIPDEPSTSRGPNRSNVTKKRKLSDIDSTW